MYTNQKKTKWEDKEKESRKKEIKHVRVWTLFSEKKKKKYKNKFKQGKLK